MEFEKDITGYGRKMGRDAGLNAEGRMESVHKLGDGAYSNVFKVRRKEDSEVYALKKVKL